MSNKRVAYFYDYDIGSFYYATKHAMKPNRIRMAHELILGYGIYKKMEIYRPHRSSISEIQRFHSKEYVDFLSKVNPFNEEEYEEEKYLYNVGQDCPIFENMFEFSQISAGGSVAGAIKLNNNLADIAINWAGGLHHAKSKQASGFCYINDIVLGILELLKFFPRVLYIDIDIHHGDGVEEAFYKTDRVMTCSFHKYGDGYFPGTGNIKDTGLDNGKYYSVNYPLLDGIYEKEYIEYFKKVINGINLCFRPSAIVMQCGADSLAGDRLGCFNLQIKGHGKCVSFVKELGVPLLILGGGGYTPKNVAKCWTYETSLLTNVSDLPEKLPETEYTSYFGENGNLLELDIKTTHIDKNTKRYLEETYAELSQNLRVIKGAPSVRMELAPHNNLIKNYEFIEKEFVEEKLPDVRIHPIIFNKLIQANNEFEEDLDYDLKYFLQMNSQYTETTLKKEPIFNFDDIKNEKALFPITNNEKVVLKRSYAFDTRNQVEETHEINPNSRNQNENQENLVKKRRTNLSKTLPSQNQEGTKKPIDK
ncbi:histone deacetylase rpd3 [Anaeramoeba flamelloides]|uniref:histone deacetylase n=1 Tax=Anaeramoeba flamelloides TaxID=1746091 RepID=A0ABQ8Z561_9EUKA|nr:histone deacetylase rpd3 [Anaeramoeba flamelloides]